MDIRRFVLSNVPDTATCSWKGNKQFNLKTHVSWYIEETLQYGEYLYFHEKQGNGMPFPTFLLENFINQLKKNKIYKDLQKLNFPFEELRENLNKKYEKDIEKFNTENSYEFDDE